MSVRMEQLAVEQPGYLGMESARDGLGMTVSYWADGEACPRVVEPVETGWI